LKGLNTYYYLTHGTLDYMFKRQGYPNMLIKHWKIDHNYIINVQIGMFQHLQYHTPLLVLLYPRKYEGCVACGGKDDSW